MYPEKLIAKIRQRIDTSQGGDACHPWKGGLNCYRGTRPVVPLGKVNYNPRRVVHELALGERLPAEQRVRDTCGNQLCCNPRHLKGGSMADRLEAQLDKSGECWVWTGYTDQKGYGRLRERRGTPWILSHRLAYNIANGVELPQDVLVLHSCDNPPCCNPAHLRPGTHAENHADMMARGRHAHGERHRKAARNAKALREAGYVKVRRPPGRPKRRAA